MPLAQNRFSSNSMNPIALAACRDYGQVGIARLLGGTGEPGRCRMSPAHGPCFIPAGTRLASMARVSGSVE